MSHPGDGVMGDASGGVRLGEEEVGVFRDFDGRHATGVYGIADPNEHKTDHDDSREADRIVPEGGESLTPRVSHLGEGVEDHKESKDREDEECREFGQLGETESDTGQEHGLRGWVFEEADKTIKSDENKASTAEIGRHVVVVGDDIGIRGIERDSDETSEDASEFPSPPKEPKTEENREDDNRQAREEKDGVGIVTSELWSRAVDKHVAHQPLFVVAGLPGIGLNRKVKVEREEKETREIFDEGWVFRIEAHVPVSDVAIRCWDMGSLIVGHRFL